MHSYPRLLQNHKKKFDRPYKLDGKGFSEARLARMNATLQAHVEGGKVPGLVALVHHRDREHVVAMGTQTLTRDEPMRRNCIFRLASMTKPITAVAAMILVEECKIRLDDPVDEWLPELKERKVLRTIDSPLDDTVPAKRSITVRDLFTFRSGYGEVEFLSPSCPLHKAMVEARLPLSVWPFASSADELMKILSALPLAHQPGERWLYHMSAEILGVLIARVTGQSLAEFFHERIFDPLGMKDTAFYLSDDKIGRLPTCYQTDFLTGEISVLEEASRERVIQAPAFESGGGGLLSTVDDLLNFSLMMLGKSLSSRQHILSRPAIELMTIDHMSAEQKAVSPFFEDFWRDRGWGLGLSVVTRRSNLADTPGRFGWDGAFGTSWYIDPREEMVGILMTQVRPSFPRLPKLNSDFWTSAYQLIDD